MRSVFEIQSSETPIVLKNKTCVYCGIGLEREATREHVIARKFVPHIKWGLSWNLIVQACSDCNFHKSKLENDISAITLQIHAQDPELKDLVHRKAIKSKSAKTGKVVGSSTEHSAIVLPFGPGINIKFKMMAPPQVEETRAFELARLQMNAFFYLITYDEGLCKGRFWEGKFSPISCSHKADWGNVTKIAFMEVVKNWERRLVGVTADGFFKVMLKKHPTEKCFGWALEWNHSHRIFGFLGDRDFAEKLYKTFPKPMTEVMPLKNNEAFSIRMDQALNDDADTLFQ
jgi:hypothetical protein